MNNLYTLIVGGTGLIGNNIAKNLAAKGRNLILLYKEKECLAQSICESINSTHKVECLIYRCDISNENEVVSFFDYIEKKQIYIENVIFAATGPMKRVNIEESNAEEWLTTVNIGIFGLYLCIREIMKKANPELINRVLIISSTSAFGGMPYLTDYAATKSAQIGFAKSLALECATKNVLVNVIAPGLIEEGTEASLHHERIGMSPLRRLTKVADVLNIVDFLLSVNSDSLTGQTFILDAGNDARYRYLLD